MVLRGLGRAWQGCSPCRAQAVPGTPPLVCTALPSAPARAAQVGRDSCKLFCPCQGSWSIPAGWLGQPKASQGGAARTHSQDPAWPGAGLAVLVNSEQSKEEEEAARKVHFPAWPCLLSTAPPSWIHFGLAPSKSCDLSCAQSLGPGHLSRVLLPSPALAPSLGTHSRFQPGGARLWLSTCREFQALHFSKSH